MPKQRDTASINILSNFKRRTKEEQKSLDHPGFMHEYVFNQKLTQFQWEWLECFMDAYRNPLKYSPTLILAPRNHGKTAIVCESIPLWYIGKHPTTTNQIISATDGIAKTRVSKIANVIRNNPRYISLFGELYPGSDQTYRWSPSGEAIEVKIDREAIFERDGDIARDPTLTAYGIQTSVEGGRANLQIFDDVINSRNAKSASERATILERFEQAFMPMLYPDGVRFIIGTRYHYQDLYAHLLPILDQERLYTDLYADDLIDEAYMPE